MAKWFRFIGLMLATTLLLLSCQRLFGSASLSEPSPEIVKLSGWSASPAEQRLLQQVLTQFEENHPNIKVKFEVIADQYMDVIKTRLIGDAAPDVFYLDALEAPFLIRSGVLEPLDAYITPEFDLTDFEPKLLQPFQQQNQTFGLPKDYSTLALFYSKQAFAEAGLTDPPATWEELLLDAKQLTLDRDQNGRPERYGLGIMPELARQAHRITAFGGEIVDQQGYANFASEAGVQGLEALVAQYQTDRTSARPVDVGVNSGTEMFGQGKAAMVIEGAWAISFLQDTFPDLDYATAPIPLINGRPSTMIYTAAYVMNQKSQHKQAAWQLISYLTGKEGMRQWVGTGITLPPRKSVATVLQYDRDPLRSPLVAGVSDATPWQMGEYPAPIMNSFNNQFISVILGQQSLQTGLQRAQVAANQQIAAAQ